MGPVMDTFAKLAANEIPIGQISFARFFIQSMIIIPIAFYLKILYFPRINEIFLHFTRAFFILTATSLALIYAENYSWGSAYFMMAARALGLDCGPISGFDNATVDATFFANTNVKSNFICSIGYGSDENLYPRSPRLEFSDACRID